MWQTQPNIYARTTQFIPAIYFEQLDLRESINEACDVSIQRPTSAGGVVKG